MTDHGLLLRHAESWASTKGRAFDRHLVETVLDLRQRHDAVAATHWPAGSVERVLLTLWPAYGPADPPEAETLVAALDTFFRFLRATGRMASGSAQPALLAKEARHASRKMADAIADPGHHSQSRVLEDFGREIGIELDGADSIEELQDRLDRIQDAWNALPVEDRRRRMPDASPKGLVGQVVTRGLQEMLAESEGAAAREGREPWPRWEPDPADDEDVEWSAGDEAAATRQAQHASYVRQCVALADWVGDGREVTATGVLRPAVAREAYAALDLWSWERTSPLRAGQRAEDVPPEVDRLLAEGAQHSWTSAGDCLALDRLWFACEAAGLIDIASRRAVRTDRRPTTDEEWLGLGATLVLGQCLRLGREDVEPLVGLLLVPGVTDEGSVPLDAVRAWWDSRWAGGRGLGPPVDELVKEIWRDKVDYVLDMFDDCGLWDRDDETIAVTDFGRTFTLILSDALLDDGVLAPHS